MHARKDIDCWCGDGPIPCAHSYTLQVAERVSANRLLASNIGIRWRNKKQQGERGKGGQRGERGNTHPSGVARDQRDRAMVSTQSQKGDSTTLAGDGAHISFDSLDVTSAEMLGGGGRDQATSLLLNACFKGYSNGIL